MYRLIRRGSRHEHTHVIYGMWVRECVGIYIHMYMMYYWLKRNKHQQDDDGVKRELDDEVGEYRRLHDIQKMSLILLGSTVRRMGGEHTQTTRVGGV